MNDRPSDRCGGGDGPEPVLTAWADAYRALSRRVEYGAFLYRSCAGPVTYRTGRTLRGFGRIGPVQAHVVLPFLYFYLLEAPWFRLSEGWIPEGLVHTHPAPPPGMTSRFHSATDRWLTRLPRVPAVYVVPYENREIRRYPDPEERERQGTDKNRKDGTESERR